MENLGWDEVHLSANWYWYLLVHREGTSQHEEHEANGPSKGQADESLKVGAEGEPSAGIMSHIFPLKAAETIPSWQQGPPGGYCGYHVMNQLISRVNSYH